MVKCIKGKQYLCKKCINDHATCVACPPNLGTCYNEEIDNQKRCVDSCRKAKTKTTKKTAPSTISTIPTFSTFSLSNPSRPVSRSTMHPTEPRRYEPHPWSNNGNHPVNIWLIVVSSVLFVALFVFGIVSLVFWCRRIRRKSSRRSRAGTERRRVEEDIPLNDIPNVQVDENVRGDVYEWRDVNDVELNVQTNNEEEPYSANGTEENQPGHPSQETQPPVGTFDTRIEQSEEDTCSSRLMLKEAHN